MTAITDRYVAEILQAVPHEIILRTCGHQIVLSCACLRVPRRGRGGWQPIEMRTLFPAAEAAAAWRAWHEDRGVTP